MDKGGRGVPWPHTCPQCSIEIEHNEAEDSDPQQRLAYSAVTVICRYDDDDDNGL